MNTVRRALVLWAVCLVSLASAEVEELPPGVLEPKVVEVTVFKAGGGIFRFEGEGVVKDGELVIRSAPEPAFGTLWLYSRTKGVDAVSLNSRDVTEERTALITDTWELLSHNKGKHARIVMRDGPFDAEGNHTDWELEGTVLNVTLECDVLLRTEGGIASVNVRDIRYATVEGARYERSEKRGKREMFIRLKGAEEGQQVRVGYTCLQGGIKWLPSYRMDIEGSDATLTLSASVINDIADVGRARASFVVGRPVFELENQLSPIAMSNSEMDLAEFFEKEQEHVEAGPRDIWGDLDEFITTNLKPPKGDNVQYDILYYGGTGWGGVPAGQMPITAEIAEAWHLLYYTAEDVTVSRDTSSSVVLWKYENPVEHVFVWPAEQPEVYQNASYARKLEGIYSGGIFTSDTVEDKSKAKVKYSEAGAPIHCIRLENQTGQPWASAPLLVYEKSRALGQVWMPYTPAEKEVESAIGPANDIVTQSAEREIKRVVGEEKEKGRELDLVTIEGFLKIKNKRDETAKVEVRRAIEGTPVARDSFSKVTTHRDSPDDLHPASIFKWEIEVKAGEEKELTYTYSRYVVH